MNRIRSYFTRDRLILLIAAFVLYANTLVNGYSLDDGYVTQKENITAKGLSSIPKLLTSYYGTGKDGLQYDFRPLVKISFAIEHQFFGVSAGTSHFFNILLYVACLFLIYNFVRLLIYPARNNIPLYVSLMFAFLPIHTEVVASIKNRDIMLAFIFTLLTANMILRAHNEKGVNLRAYLFALFFLFLAFMSKLDALPYLIILPAIIFIRHKVSYKQIAVLGVITFGGFVIYRTFMLAATKGVQLRPHFFFENPLFLHSTFGLKIIATFNSLGFYIAQCLFPYKQSCYYGADTIPVSGMSFYGYLGVLSAAGLIWLAIYSWKKDRNLLVGVIMFSFSISMYLNLARPVVGIVADRFTFFASLGSCIAVVFALQKPFSLDKKLPSSVRNVALLLFLVYGYMTISRNTEWKNADTILSSDVKKFPASAYLNYLDASGKLRIAERRDIQLPGAQRQTLMLEAKKELESSVAVANDYPSSLILLSRILIFYEKNYAQALPHVNQALHLLKNSDLYFYKALCFEGMKNDSSEYYLKETIKMDSSAMNAYRILANHYNTRGEYDKSFELLSNAVKKGIVNETIYSELAAVCFLKKDTALAKQYCEKILSINPNNQRAREVLKQLK